jgi:hypothetical protein
MEKTIKLLLGVTLFAVVTGCVGYVGPDGGPDVVVDPGPVWVGGVWRGGDHWHHGDVGRFSHRGAVSRGFAGHHR